MVYCDKSKAYLRSFVKMPEIMASGELSRSKSLQQEGLEKLLPDNLFYLLPFFLYMHVQITKHSVKQLKSFTYMSLEYDKSSECCA